MLFQNTLGFIFSLLLFAFYYFFGYSIIKCFSKKLSKRLKNCELILISFFVGIFFHTWISFIIALILKQIILGHIVSAFLGLIFIFFNRKLFARNYRVYKGINKHFAALLLFFLITCSLLFTVFFTFKGDKIYNTPPNYGDWALHISLINNFAFGNNIPPYYTFYSGMKLGYPFLNFYANAILVNLGLDVYYAYNLFHFVLTFAVLVLSYLLGIRLFEKKPYAVMFAILLFFGAGLGWIYLFQSKEPLLISLQNNDYFIVHEKNILPLNVSIYSYSQSTGLVGWVYLSIVLILLFDEIFNLRKWMKLKEYFIVILLIGGLFFFHSYSFLTLMLLLATVWIQKPVKTLFYVITSAGVLSIQQMLYTVNQTLKKGFFQLIDGLFVSFKEPLVFLWFWIQNFGLIIVFAVIGFKNKYRHLILPLIVFFIVGNTILFQPWDFDNHKWLIGCYFILTIFGTYGIKWFWELKKKNKIELIISRSFVVLVIVVILLPPILGNYYYYENQWEFSSYSDKVLGEAIGSIVPQHSIILTATQHNHPVFLYSGRKVFEGYRGWIWTHGLNLEAKDKETKAMFESSNKTEACDLFKKNKIDYVFISDWERNERLFKVNETFFKNNFKVVLRKGDSMLFRIKC